MMIISSQNLEPEQYLRNAQNILNEDIGQDSRYYSSKKNVRDAGNLALKGILLSMQKHLDFSKEFNFNLYQETISKINPYMAKVFGNAYDTLSKSLIEYVNLNIIIVEEGLREAQELIDWCENTLQLNEPIVNKRKSLMKLVKEIPKGRYKGLSEIVNQEYEYVKGKKDET
jgi:Domain of unknown function (DUF5618)